jgi:hypothetical protein
MKALICYWGLIRGFKYKGTFESHKKYIWNVLKEQDIEFDVMLHTYNKEFDFQVFNIENLKYFVIEDDNIITERILPKIRNVHMPKYFHEQHRRGLFKCWYSQQHLHNHILPIKHEYDIIITLDIAQYIVSPIPNNIKFLDMSYTYLTNFETFDGYNPRFCMSNVDNVLFYLNKFNYVLRDEDNIPQNMVNPEYAEKYIEAYMEYFNTSRDKVKQTPNIHPEWQLKTYLDSVGNKKVKEILIKFWRIRENAQIEGITEEDIKLYKVNAIPA